MLNVNNANGLALQAMYGRRWRGCRVFVGHIWDNGNGGGARDDGTGRR